MMHNIVYQAPAKINLALHVVGQSNTPPNTGYHLLESVVCFGDIGDAISFLPITNIESGQDFSLKICGPFSKELNSSLLNNEDNLILKAADFTASYFSNKHNTPKIGGEITLIKNLPISSGIGGGSADAAATIRAIAKFLNFELSKEFIKSTASLGADVPMCLYSSPLIARGIGDEIKTLNTLPAFHLLLVNPNVAVSTPAIFMRLSSKNNMPLLELPQGPNWMDWLSSQRNDLQIPAIQCEPIIGDVLGAIHNCGAQLVRMSGSGATCFGIFKNAQECETARLKIATDQPNWWCVATKTNPTVE